MSGLLKNFDMMSDGPKVILTLAAISLWVVSFVINKKAIDNLKDNTSEMKNQVNQFYAESSLRSASMEKLLSELLNNI